MFDLINNINRLNSFIAAEWPHACVSPYCEIVKRSGKYQLSLIIPEEVLSVSLIYSLTERNLSDNESILIHKELGGGIYPIRISACSKGGKQKYRLTIFNISTSEQMVNCRRFILKETLDIASRLEAV